MNFKCCHFCQTKTLLIIFKAIKFNLKLIEADYIRVTISMIDRLSLYK